MKNSIKKISFLLAVIATCNGLQAKSGTDSTLTYPPSSKVDNQFKFKMSGYGSFNFIAPSGGDAAFSSSQFSPIFTIRPTDKLFFQTEVEFASEDGTYDGAFELEFATFNYFITKKVTLYGGKFLGPLGTFQARYHPSWINKSITKPIGFGSKINGLKRLQAGSEAGVGIKGVTQVGIAKINYDVYIANGGILDDTNGDLEMESFADNNANKAIGGRLGILPLPGSSLEIGFSGYTAKVSASNSLNKNASVTILGADLNFVKAGSFGKVDVKGEYQQRTVNGASYYADPTDVTTVYTYNNSPSVMYGQLAYRLPALGNINFIGNIELMGRYTTMKVDNLSPYGSNVNDLMVGINYWLNFSTVLKLGYESTTYTTINTTNNTFLAQIAMGF